MVKEIDIMEITEKDREVKDQMVDKSKFNDYMRIKTAITTADYLNGGELNPEQEKQFDQFIRGSSDLLANAEIKYVNQSKGNIPRLFIGEVISEAATEATDSGNTAKPIFGEINFDCKKIRTAADVSTEFLVNNIEGEGFKTTLMSTFGKAFGNDLSKLAVRGDILSAHPLYQSNDGFYKLSNNCHIVDAEGAEISSSIYHAAYKRLPNEYRMNKSALRWMMNGSIEVDWLEVLGARATSGGDAAVAGAAIRPLGIPIVAVNEIQDDLTVSYTSATKGTHKGTIAGPFIVTTGVNDTFKVQVTVGGVAGVATTITITAGVYEATELAAFLNAAMVTAGEPEVFDTDGNGHLRVTATLTGATSNVDVQAVANSIYATVGMTAGNYVGAAAGANTVPMGSYMWLTDPKNFVVVIRKGPRISFEYKPRTDKWEYTMYNEADFIIRHPGACVRVDNLKVK